MMDWPRRFRQSNFFIRLSHWEFWPFGILQGPVFIYWLWLSIRARSLFFFSASNPGILSGGMMGESKFDVLSKVPSSIKPKTILLKQPATRSMVLSAMRENNINFPLILKPDIGERGWLVRLVKSEAGIEEYLREIRIDFLMQPYIDLPLEFGVFYYRFPGKAEGVV